jgi:hypothetical protein
LSAAARGHAIPMSAPTDSLEQQLVRDLERLGDRLADDRLVTDLYDAIAGHALHPHGGQGRLTPSWGRAEELLNAARATQGHAALDGLSPTGREGEVSNRARDALREIGWDLRRHGTGADDRGHTSRAPEQHRAASETPEWRREGDAEADAELRRRRE